MKRFNGRKVFLCLLSVLLVSYQCVTSPCLSMPERTIPPLSDILAASELLSDGDIPVDNSTTQGMTPLYVATNGNNNNSGLSITAPKRNLGAAIEYANSNPGKPIVIYMRGGTYYRPAAYEYLEIQRGNLMITAYPGESVTVRPHFWPNNPTSWGEEVILYSYGPHQNITIRDLTLQGWSCPFVFGAIFNVPPMRNVVIKNIRANEFRKRGSDFITSLFSTNYIGEGYFSGGDFDPSDPGIKYQIEGLILSNIYLENVDLPINIGDEDDANVKGLRISQLEVRNPAQGIGETSASDGLAIVNCDKVLIDNCIIDNIEDDGIDTKSLNVSIVNTLVQGTGRNAVKFWHSGELINSIIYDCTPIDDGAFIITGAGRMINSILMKKSVGYAGTLNYAETSSDKFEVVNSILMDLDHTFYLGTNNLQSENSLYFDMPGGLFSGQTTANSLAELNSLTNCSGNISAKPLFTNPAGEDFRLNSNSPCRDAGTATGVLLPSFDYLGNSRPQGGGYDIGPCEYASATPAHQSNYINLEVTPTSASPGGYILLTFRTDFSHYNYEGLPVDVYLAAVKKPKVTDVPSSVSDVLGGGGVYLYGNKMQSVYRFNGTVREPTWSNIAFPPVAASGSRTISVPSNPAISGDYAFAVVLVLRDTGNFVRTDGLPVENSNFFRIL